MSIVKSIETAVNAASNLCAHHDAASRITLSIKPILYHSGQKQDVIRHTLTHLTGHPCHHAARQLLTAAENKTEHHGFIGLAHGRETSLFGLRQKHFYIGFVAINLDHVTSVEDALHIFYHAAGHALDTYNLLKKDQSKTTNSDFVLLPKRNQLSTARANLRADIFSSFMLQNHDVSNAVDWLADKRATAAITTQTYIKPEDYPFPIALDVAKLASQKAADYKEHRTINLHALANRVTQTFDKSSVAAWIGFAAPAQNLAWSGYDEKTILGLAIHSSPNPLIKSTGHLISEITGIKADNEASVQDGYNPFVGRDANRAHHMKKAEEQFEIALVHALQSDSAEPLIRTANNQNEELLKGRVIGWCAHALQAAGNAFTTAQNRGMAPDQATRMMFDGQKTIPDWNGLQDLNNFVMAQRRQGFGITMQDVTSWCKRHTDMAVVMESLDMTMRNPAYAAQLAVVNEMPMPGPRASHNFGLGFAHAPSSYNMAPTAAPTFSAAPQMGGMMGGMSGGSMMARPAVIAAQQHHNIELVDEA